MGRITVVCCFLLFPCLLIGQTSFVEKGKQYSLARIYPKGGGVFRARNFEMVNDSVVSFLKNGSPEIRRMDVTNLNFVVVKNGSMALPYGLYGAGLGLLSGLYGVSTVKADPNLDDSQVNWVPFVGAMTAGFGFIGMIIGAATPKWKRLYLPDRTTAYSLKVVPDFGNRYSGIRIVAKF